MHRPARAFAMHTLHTPQLSGQQFQKHPSHTNSPHQTASGGSGAHAPAPKRKRCIMQKKRLYQNFACLPFKARAQPCRLLHSGQNSLCFLSLCWCSPAACRLGGGAHRRGCHTRAGRRRSAAPVHTVEAEPLHQSTSQLFSARSVGILPMSSRFMLARTRRSPPPPMPDEFSHSSIASLECMS